MITYYKFLNANRKTSNTDYQWPEPGEWTSAIKGALVACENGYHLCRPQDLTHWINSDLWECEVKGAIVESDNKIVAHRARLVRHVDAWNERTQRLFACDCAERALNLVSNPDPRSVEAVRVARLYAIGEATNEQLAAAWGRRLGRRWGRRSGRRLERRLERRLGRRWGMAIRAHHVLHQPAGRCAMTRPDAVPAPGSEAAMRAGCKCVFYDPEWLSVEREITYSVDVRGCPLHDPYFLTTMRPLHGDPLDNLTMRPRTDAETGGSHVD